MSFSEMIEVLGVTNSFLTYHLGEAAMATMTKVEDSPATAPHQSPEARTKKTVGRSVAMTLGLICIVLIVLIAYLAVAGISAQNSYNNLRNQNNQLQTWLDGNETLLNQTQANNTNLQNQVNNLTDALNLGEYLSVVNDQTRLPVLAWSDTSISFGSNTWMFLYQPSFDSGHQEYLNFPFPFFSTNPSQDERLIGQPILISVMTTVGQSEMEGRLLNATSGASYTWDGMEIAVVIANPYYVVLEFRPSS